MRARDHRLAVVLLLAIASTALSAYTPPGVLGAIVEEKRREVERLKKLPEARNDGPWALRLGYPAASASYALGQALGWRRETPAVLIDLKRASPTGRLGDSTSIDPTLVISTEMARAVKLGVAGAMVCTDLGYYGGSMRDLKDATSCAREALAQPDGQPLPIIAKDIIVDPIQIARAACEGAHAVLLIAAACLADLPALLDTCTLLGVEAIVEVHTPDEVRVASECAAPLLLVNERDRATGKLIVGQAASIAPLLPPDTTCLACGGITRIDQIRTLRRAGYDGFVIGRAFAGDPRSAEALIKMIGEEPPLQRWSETISVPKRSGGEAMPIDGPAYGGQSTSSFDV